jgi:tight adherence protein C
MPELLPATLTFVTTALFVLALFPPRAQTLRQRLAPYGHRSVPARERVLAHSFIERLLAPTGRRLMGLAGRTAPTHIRQQAALDLARAGHPLSVDLYLALRGAAMLGLPLAYVAYLAQSGQPIDTMGMLIVAGLFFVGSRGSGWWVRRKARARQNKIERALPSALDLITVCMEAGLSFDSGLAKVVEKTRGPLADEFARVLQEMQIGKPRRTALRDMAHRVDVRDVSSFVAAIVQADQMGMSLGPAMRVQADEVRTRRRQLVEEQAMKAPVKMLFPLVLFILPATMLVVLGPAIVTLFTEILRQMAEWG